MLSRRTRAAIGLIFVFAFPLDALATETFIRNIEFSGMPAIPLTIGELQTALRAGNAPIFNVNVYSPYIIPAEVTADLSGLGITGPTVIPVESTFGPNSNYPFSLLISPEVSDGHKTIPVTIVDYAGDTVTGTGEIIVDNALPTATLTSVTFSTSSPQGGDAMYLSGTVDGTGTVAKISGLTMRLFDLAGSPVISPIVGGSIGYDPSPLNTALVSSGDGSFTNVPIQLLDFGDKNWYPRAESMRIEITVYDQAGNFFTSALTVSLRQSAGGVSSILFLPGLEASRLYRGDDMVWEPLGDSDALNLSMNPNGSAERDDLYTRDVIDNAYFTPIKGDVYKSFLEQLGEMKTEDIINDFAVTPYDWRLALTDVLARGALREGGKLYYAGTLGATSSPYIIQELRRLAKSSQTGKVTIIAHSNGGLLAKALTNALGTEAATLIDKMIFVAVPQAGTPKAIGALLHGFEQALPMKLLSPFGMTEATARTLARNMPSVYNLIPSENYSTYVDDPVVTISDDPLLAPWRTAYAPDGVIHSGERLKDFITDSSRVTLPTASSLTSPIIGNGTLYTDAEEVHNAQDSWSPPSGVELIEIAGWGMETLKTIAYYEGRDSTCTSFRSDSTCAALISTPALKYKPELVLDGDGTVVVPSALWTPGSQKYWVDLKDYDSLFTVERKHADILEIPELRTFIQNLIVTSGAVPLPRFIYTSTPDDAGEEKILHFTLHSPLTLNLYDNLGNHTGFSTTTNSLEENIPGSHYLTFGEVQYINVPAFVGLNLVMEGYEDGSFTLDIEETEGETVLAATTFSGIPSLTDTVVRMSVPADTGIEGASDLQIDFNGDGTIDVSVEPNPDGVATLPLYRFDGFLQPINDTAHQVGQDRSVFKAGSTVPVKFQLKTPAGMVTQAITPPVWLPPKPGAPMTASIDEPIYSAPATTGSVYKWDETAQQYVYNWNTKGYAKGRWYEIYAKLDDGSVHSVTIGLR